MEISRNERPEILECFGAVRVNSHSEQILENNARPGKLIGCVVCCFSFVLAVLASSANFHNR
jgi:hypothetical protein